ncbi:DUF116 domain-containing protein [Clostridium sporogenes]|uniref:DUF116 domain-containing protein n=1 Tax=Clostridium botulinum TaxID=1491 RepID=A0A6M0T3I6_CLOBO|nr:DUF116 domain-containing protein [Clostridium sporogenes]NFA61984.1 DUF116 domain-containing protein [Clostridium botulinum]NFI72377.1 DUF116 domain-containing protein [Clostridium sporogenes]NFL73874.1 DUF116 domain-containing protein [Clostridium sporogenes]NFM25210.1 DUF116 domain-containing protein [Clostridium sporogenes]NFP60775.1 DUF116 domain-containing protein [Clostridium sporogenes]
MREIITYTLCNKDKNSNRYYQDVSFFTDEVVSKIYNESNNWIYDFTKFILKNNIEKLRSNAEYLLELLMLGVLWRCYVNKAILLKNTPKNILIKLSKLREKENMKKSSDFLRGILETLFLYKNSSYKVDYTLDNVKKLIQWLLATGEFKQEVKRLERWEKFLCNKSEDEIKNFLLLITNLGEWFEARSEEVLGIYTKNINEFHNSTYKKHKWKEDYIYRGRKRVEYHLNMVGADILNRAYREEFLKTKEKRLLLPACMRLNFNNCKACKTKNGYVCEKCTKFCKVNMYTKLGGKYNFEVYIIPHESSAFVKEKIKKDYTGIIGVACVLNLISGGWKAKELGFIPQCVLLDYCGCKNHWHEKGIVTDINSDRLLYIIGIEK